jgi:hypothetical protein
MADSFIARFTRYYNISLGRLASRMYKHREAIEEYCKVRGITQTDFIREVMQ